MRWIAIAFVIGMLTGCIAPPYDPSESMYLATIKVSADSIHGCPTVDAITHDLELPARIALELTRYRTNSIDVANADQSIIDLVVRFKAAYATGTPSDEYCRQKLANISAAAETVLKTYGGLK